MPPSFIMIKFLDFLIFGNGGGIAAPYFNQVFYWLKDSNTGRSTFYTWCGWFGTQLQSFQWTHPNAGERRFICGYEFHPFSSRRIFCRVQVAWKCDKLNTNKDIMEFKSKIYDT